MAISARIMEVRRSLARRGLLPTARLALRGLYRIAFPRKPSIHPFDLQHGVDTSGLAWAPELRFGHAHDDFITAYWGTAPSLFDALLAHWKQTLSGTSFAPNDYTFVDVGCGKGRMLMQASNTAFAQVLDVELVPSLAETAQANLIKWKQTSHACNNLAVVNADALDFPFPSGPTLLYIYNPFDSKILELLLDRIQLLSKHRTTPVDLAFIHRFSPKFFTERPKIHLLWEGTLRFSKEDADADIFYGEEEECCIYRIAGSAHET